MQQMQQGQTANELARYQLSSAQRADELATNRLGNLRAAGSDPAKVANAFLQSGDIKGYSEFMKSRGEQEKMQTEAVDAKLKQSKQFLDTIDPTDPNAPALYMQWHKANHSDPVLGPVLAARGITPEQSMDRIKKALEAGPAAFATLLNQSKLGTEKFIELNKPTTQVIDRSGQRDVIQTSGLGGAPTTVGTYVDVPLPAGVEAQNLRRAAAGATRVSVDTGKKYGEAVAAGAGADDLKLFAQARQIPQDIEKIDQTLNILKKSDINTGLGAEVFTVLDRARAQFAADKKAGARVTSTEYLDSLLGSAVFPQIQALGIGARGMDTPAEREFLRKVMTGSITLNKDTLIKMTELRRNMLEDQAKQFNARVDSGELTRFFEAAGRKPMKINVPAYSSGGAHPADIQAILDAQKAK
jgi:hypothetical protein